MSNPIDSDNTRKNNQDRCQENVYFCINYNHMQRKQSIQELAFTNLYKKDFEFSVVTNKEVLRDKVREDINPFKPTRLHYYAILFILEGEGRHFIDFKTYQYKRGSIIFVAKGQVHAFERNVDRRAIFFGFTEAFLEKNSFNYKNS